MILETLTVIFSAIAAIAAIKSALTTEKEARLNKARWNYNLMCEEPEIKLVAKAYCPGPVNSKYNKYALFNLIFNNTSKLDIAITRIFLLYNDQSIEFKWQPDIIPHRQDRKIETERLPIHIPAMGAIGGYFVVYNDNYEFDFNKLMNTPFKIKIYTSRGHNPEFYFDKVSIKYDI